MGKLRCGGLDKFMVIKWEDIWKYLSDTQKRQMERITRTIRNDRERDGKSAENEYIVINTDEPYIDEIIEILKKNNQWG